MPTFRGLWRCAEAARFAAPLLAPGFSGVRGALAVACVLAAAPLAPTPAAAQAPIEWMARWSFASALHNQEAENISAAVCAPAGAMADPARHCLLVSDEVSGKGKRYVRFVALEDGARGEAPVDPRTPREVPGRVSALSAPSRTPVQAG